jgi:very-short-patch-repair endonuclease
MTRLFNRVLEKEKGRSLRKNMPPAGTILWSKLRGKNLDDLKFKRQHSIGSSLVDFYSPQCKLAIEIDGESHYVDSAMERDRIRQRAIETAGVTFLRFTNCDVYERLESVIEKILEKTRKTDLP